jgi:hypothetical protein
MDYQLCMVAMALPANSSLRAYKGEIGWTRVARIITMWSRPQDFMEDR